MSQQVRNYTKQSRRAKTKGAPAHNNKFAFKHNPKSKKTAKIAKIPNHGVCLRCEEQIEWRKKYRYVRNAGRVTTSTCVRA
jgi:hypothetical protein